MGSDSFASFDIRAFEAISKFFLLGSPSEEITTYIASTKEISSSFKIVSITKFHNQPRFGCGNFDWIDRRGTVPLFSAAKPSRS